MNKVHTCITSGVIVASVMDKPNFHRLIELVVHTIPRFGHARFVSDLTFEHKQKNLKKLYRRGNNMGYNHLWSITPELFEKWTTDLAYMLQKAELCQNTAPAKPSVYTDNLF